MADNSTTFTLSIHHDDDGMLWGEVKELPGCFVSGADIDELKDAAAEAIEMYLQEDRPSNVVSLADRRLVSSAPRARAMPTALVLEG